MNKIQLFIYTFICLISLCFYVSGSPSATTITTLYVNSSSSVDSSLCGDSIDNACGTLSDAIYSFLNTTSIGQGNSILPPLVIEVLQDYIPSADESILFYGFNLTVQPYSGDGGGQVTFYGQNRGGAYLFNFPSVTNNTAYDSVLVINNITFDSFASGIVYYFTQTPVGISVNNCQMQSSLYNSYLFYLAGANRASYTNFYNTNYLIGVSDFLTVRGGSLVFSNGYVTSDSPDNCISLFNTSAYFENSIFSNNTGASYIIYATDSTLDIAGTMFMSNQGNYVVGASTSAVSIDGTYFISNTLLNYGPVFVNQGSLSITNSEFIGNLAYMGGAVYSWGSKLSVSNTLFQDNNAVSGMAIYMRNNNITITDSVLSYSVNHSKIYTNQNDMIYLYMVPNAQFRDTAISVGRHGVPSTSFSVFDCVDSVITYEKTDIRTEGHQVLSCQTCLVNNDNVYHYSCSSNTSDSSSGSSSTNSNSTSDSDSSNSSNDYLNVVLYQTSLVLLIFFISLLLISLVIIVSCCVRRERKTYLLIQ
ncbi:hypothetical protein CYY_004154 [Polysphondylium violaceum]|uniref:Adhesin-like protein n=1 Tax=Polysphondylium violaceum TaxID=133409 RepID=A0A8J4PVM6_9MYCE|nr:hypothetical protein CYY_004154 [Polysphondylium violaceum]